MFHSSIVQVIIGRYLCQCDTCLRWLHGALLWVCELGLVHNKNDRLTVKLLMRHCELVRGTNFESVRGQKSKSQPAHDCIVKGSSRASPPPAVLSAAAARPALMRVHANRRGLSAKWTTCARPCRLSAATMAAPSTGAATLLLCAARTAHAACRRRLC